MAIVTEVRFAHEHGALAHTLNALPTVDVNVVREAATDPEQNVYVFSFAGADPGTLQDALEADPTVDRVDSMSGYEDELRGVVFTEETKLLAPSVTSHGGFVLEAQSTDSADGPRGWHERWLLPDRRALHDIWQIARDQGFAFDVLEFRDQGLEDPEHSGPYVLTEEQREALVVACKEGYFEEPRETSLEKLAAEMDLSASAVGARLRRGMKSLIGMSLTVEDFPEFEGDE